MRRALSASLLACLVLWSGALLAAEPSTCASSYEEGQVARAEGQLRRAREALSLCTQPECADFVRADCGRWLAEVEAALPSVVLAASSDGSDVQDVSVTLDGAPLVATLDGKAVAVEPGKHSFVFRATSGAEVTIEVVISEGEKNRKLSVELKRAPAKPGPSDMPPSEPAPQSRSLVLPGVLLGVAALGVTGFVTFGALGQSQKHDLEESCAPRCDDASIAPVERKFLIADISAGVAALALAGSAYAYFSARGEPARATARRALDADVHVSARGANAAVRWSF